MSHETNIAIWSNYNSPAPSPPSGKAWPCARGRRARSLPGGSTCRTTSASADTSSDGARGLILIRLEWQLKKKHYITLLMWLSSNNNDWKYNYIKLGKFYNVFVIISRLSFYFSLRLETWLATKICSRQILRYRWSLLPPMAFNVLMVMMKAVKNKIILQDR